MYRLLFYLRFFFAHNRQISSAKTKAPNAATSLSNGHDKTAVDVGHQAAKPGSSSKRARASPSPQPAEGKLFDNLFAPVRLPSYHPNSTLEANSEDGRPSQPKKAKPEVKALTSRQIGFYHSHEKVAMSEGRRVVQMHMALLGMYPDEVQMVKWVDAAYKSGWEHALKRTSESVPGTSSHL